MFWYMFLLWEKEIENKSVNWNGRKQDLNKTKHNLLHETALFDIHQWNIV